MQNWISVEQMRHQIHISSPFIFLFGRGGGGFDPSTLDGHCFLWTYLLNIGYLHKLLEIFLGWGDPFFVNKPYIRVKGLLKCSCLCRLGLDCGCYMVGWINLLRCIEPLSSRQDLL